MTIGLADEQGSVAFRVQERRLASPEPIPGVRGKVE